MKDKDKENQSESKQEVKLEDLPPDEESTDDIKGGQRGAANWIFSG